jgi:hypothetical protein
VPGQPRVDVRPFVDPHLHERALLGIDFPRRGLLARREAHHDIADAADLAGLHDEVLRDVVALVEQPEGRHAILHRGAERASRGDGGPRALREFLGDLGLDRIRPRRFVVPAGGKAEREGQQQHERAGAPSAHDQVSGDQAS